MEPLVATIHLLTARAMAWGKVGVGNIGCEKRRGERVRTRRGRRVGRVYVVSICKKKGKSGGWGARRVCPNKWPDHVGCQISHWTSRWGAAEERISRSGSISGIGDVTANSGTGKLAAKTKLGIESTDSRVGGHMEGQMTIGRGGKGWRSYVTEAAPDPSEHTILHHYLTLSPIGITCVDQSQVGTSISVLP